ncbi:MAG: carboxyl transferase domain-containing protein [Ilumatobacteraceae bacterium]
MTDEWAASIADLEQRRRVAEAMGGEQRLARREADGRLDARAKIAALVDEGSFAEIGMLAGSGAGAAADAFVAGHATVRGRPIMIGVEDATVLGGSIGHPGASKRERIARLALQDRIPLVMVLDGAGHRATNSLHGNRPAPGDLGAIADLAGIVPVIAAVTGASAGHGVLAAALADVVVMVDGTSQMFAAGPPLVKAATGVEIDKESLGGAAVHAGSGLAQIVVADDAAAMVMVRLLLGCLPSSADSWPIEYDASPPANGDLATIIPTNLRQPYDGRDVVDAIVDMGSVLELQPEWGSGLLTCLARLDGIPIAVVASQPLVGAGAIDAPAAAKAARFIDWTGSFHLPLLFLADTPGVLPGLASERAGILRAAGAMYAAQRRHPGPKLHVTLRKAFGFGSSVMAHNPFDHQTAVFALPTATVGAMPASGAASASHADAATTDALGASQLSGVWRMADGLTYDDVIAPIEVRDRLIAALRRSIARRDTTPAAPIPRFGR